MRERKFSTLIVDLRANFVMVSMYPLMCKLLLSLHLYLFLLQHLPAQIKLLLRGNKYLHDLRKCVIRKVYLTLDELRVLFCPRKNTKKQKCSTSCNVPCCPLFYEPIYLHIDCTWRMCLHH